MDALAVVLLRRTGRIAVTVKNQAPADGPAWMATLEADLADRGWLMRDDLRVAVSGLPVTVRVRWADWLLATVDEFVGADRPMVPLYRSFPDTPRDIEAVFVRRLLTHLFAVPGAPCVLCGRAGGGAPLDPCGHPVCPACFPPESFSGCPVCGRRLAAADPYLTIALPDPPAGPPRRASTDWREEAGLDDPGPDVPPMPMRVAGLETDPAGAAVRERDLLVARTTALGEGDRADLKLLVTATAAGRLDWLPEVVPARETLALIIAWALHATALMPTYPAVVDAARRRWGTATDAARTLWAYSGGDPGLVLESPAPRPVGEPTAVKPVTRVRALPRPLRRAVLDHLDGCGVVNAAEDMRRHEAVWKRLGERLHPYENVARHPSAAVAFAALRGTRTPRDSALGAAVVAACTTSPRHLELVEHDDDRVSVRLHTHAALVERAFADGDVIGAARLLGERPGDLWRRLDHLLRAAEDDPDTRAAGDHLDTRAAILAVAERAAARVAPAVLATAAAELAGRATTVPATAEQLAALMVVKKAERAPTGNPASVGPPLTSPLRDALEAAAPGLPAALRDLLNPPPGERDTEPAEGGTTVRREPPGPDVPRRIFFPRGGVVTSWTEPEHRTPLPPDPIAAVRRLVDGELTARAARHHRFDVAVLDAALTDAPAPMRERASSSQLAGWPRGSVRALPDAEVLRLFLHWEEPENVRVDLDLSCVFFDRDWRRVGHCDFSQLRFGDGAANHSGDLTSAPAPLGATEYLDLHPDRLAAEGVHYIVPMVLSFNAIPFENLPQAFAGVMLPLADGRQFDRSRVPQRFDLHGNARMMLPMVVDLSTRRLLWTDLTLTGTGTGHSVGRHGDQLARAAADQWDHFLGGRRATVLDLMAWHAAGRCDRVLIGHADGTFTEVPAEVEAIRAAGAEKTGPIASRPDLSGRVVLAGVVDARSVNGVPVAADSIALAVTGDLGPPWTALSAGDLMAGLAPR
ncbi:MXAN_6230/SCO0854 family RING domain-containing protein [Actinoplanes sp. HUAS TT8]|uniref:MXAN_6230/SCO0854 family RING domain-containing protein n=1 Tax=Actinoplanes sp. HUAS TT8 TaxID=3447453 RepID=UPI003F528D6E